jgi:site-specific DNA-cytosine methylase
LDSRRGIIIGNAVTVNVAEWIGKRIIRYVQSARQIT